MKRYITTYKYWRRIKDLMYEVRRMGNKISNSIEELSYVTEESTRMLNNSLGEINSSLNTNNLLTMIQTYQTYKINKNTKSLRGSSFGSYPFLFSLILN